MISSIQVASFSFFSFFFFLTRFVFYECVSMKLDDKVTFPLVGLSCGKHLYDLYACVCHFGGKNIYSYIYIYIKIKSRTFINLYLTIKYVFL